MKRVEKMLSILSMLWIVILLCVFSFSWVARNWTPNLTEDNITIASTGTLLIGLEDDTVYNTVELNNIVGVNSFVFKQVSSINGMDFFGLDFTPTLNENLPVFYKATNEDNRYVDVKFCLRTQQSDDPALNKSKYIFLHPDTKIVDIESGQNVSKAIRISLDTANSEENRNPIIIGDTKDNLETDNYTLAAKPNADGASYDEKETSSDFVGNQLVYNLNYFNGGRTTYDNDGEPSNDYDFELDPSRMLCTVASGEIRWINMRIWLEGGDEHCSNEISGKSFKLVLKFDSKDVPTSPK